MLANLTRGFWEMADVTCWSRLELTWHSGSIYLSKWFKFQTRPLRLSFRTKIFWRPLPTCVHNCLGENDQCNKSRLKLFVDNPVLRVQPISGAYNIFRFGRESGYVGSVAGRKTAWDILSTQIDLNDSQSVGPGLFFLYRRTEPDFRPKPQNKGEQQRIRFGICRLRSGRRNFRNAH